MRTIPAAFDALLVLVERFTVLFTAAFVAYIIVSLIFGTGEPKDSRGAKILDVLQQDWKPLLILLVPLFYKPIKKFIDELQELGPARRQLPQPPPGPQQPVPPGLTPEPK